MARAKRKKRSARRGTRKVSPEAVHLIAITFKNDARSVLLAIGSVDLNDPELVKRINSYAARRHAGDGTLEVQSALVVEGAAKFAAIAGGNLGPKK